MKNFTKNSSFWRWIIVAVIIVLAVFAIAWWLLFNYFSLPESANEFGDSFGVANALFSALAFAFLIVTAMMQRKELEMQREELRESKKALEKSAGAQRGTERALSVQVTLMAKQALLNSYQSIYQSNMSIVNSDSKVVMNKDALLNEANSYRREMDDLIQQIIGDMNLYGEPLASEKRQKLIELTDKFNKSSTDEFKK